MPLLAHHQFEIRYTKLLNFASVYKEVLQPYIPLAEQISITNENSINARCVLIMNNQKVEIHMTYDRLLIRCQGQSLDSLSSNNSIIEEPFFSIFERLQSRDDFGVISNSLFYCIFIKLISEDNLDLIIKKMSKDLFSERSLGIFHNLDDMAVTFQTNVNDRKVILRYGPYIGPEDFSQINIQLMGDTIHQLNGVGELIDIRFLETSPKVQFKTYKETKKDTQSIISSIWKV